MTFYKKYLMPQLDLVLDLDPATHNELMAFELGKARDKSLKFPQG